MPPGVQKLLAHTPATPPHVPSPPLAHASTTPLPLVAAPAKVTSSLWMVSLGDQGQPFTASGQHLAHLFLPEPLCLLSLGPLGAPLSSALQPVLFL